MSISYNSLLDSYRQCKTDIQLMNLVFFFFLIKQCVMNKTILQNVYEMRLKIQNVRY